VLPRFQCLCYLLCLRGANGAQCYNHCCHCGFYVSGGSSLAWRSVVHCLLIDRRSRVSLSVAVTGAHTQKPPPCITQAGRTPEFAEREFHGIDSGLVRFESRHLVSVQAKHLAQELLGWAGRPRGGERPPCQPGNGDVQQEGFAH